MPETLWNLGFFSTVNVNLRCFRSGYLFSRICSSPNRHGPAVCPVARSLSGRVKPDLHSLLKYLLRRCGLAGLPAALRIYHQEGLRHPKRRADIGEPM